MKELVPITGEPATTEQGVDRSKSALNARTVKRGNERTHSRP